MDQKLLDGVTIVMVEGYGDMRSVLAQFLSEQGARVISCPNAVQAFEAVKQNRPDVVLSELNLQGEDGFQLLRRIRTLGIEADGETPIIGTNSLGPTVLRGRALKEGFNEYLGKPLLRRN